MSNELEKSESDVDNNNYIGTINSKIIIVLLSIILLGGGSLAYLTYKQSKEPPIVLDEVVETIDLPTEFTDLEKGNEKLIPTSPSE